MDAIAEIVKNLLVIIMIASFLEILLPEGNIRPFVRLVVGLFVLIAILNPTLAYIYDDKSFRISYWDDGAYLDTSPEIDQGSQKIEGQIKEHGQVILKEKLEGQINAIAILVPGVYDVKTEVTLGEDGSPQKVNLKVQTEGDEIPDEVEPVNAFAKPVATEREKEQMEIRNKLLQVMSNLYSLENQNVEITFEGG